MKIEIDKLSGKYEKITSNQIEFSHTESALQIGTLRSGLRDWGPRKKQKPLARKRRTRAQFDYSQTKSKPSSNKSIEF